MEIIELAAFRDNYIWLLRQGTQVAVVDPGDAAPVIDYLERQGLSLAAILLTHHHQDHIGGVAALLAHVGAQVDLPVFGPADEGIALVNRPLHDGDQVDLPNLELHLDFLSLPGHTGAHGAYYGANALFCGDALFACGCGRLLGGTARQMFASLTRISQLPPQTRIYCAHEYTQANLRFALAVEPGNRDLQARTRSVDQLRAAGRASVPSILAEELASNPFLRSQVAAVVAAASAHAGRDLGDAEAVFTALRAWKDNF